MKTGIIILLLTCMQAFVCAQPDTVKVAFVSYDNNRFEYFYYPGVPLKIEVERKSVIRYFYIGILPMKQKNAFPCFFQSARFFLLPGCEKQLPVFCLHPHL